MTTSARPLLIYDGDCGFCVYWVRYWQRLTGEAVRYAAYQEVGQDFPQISTEEFRRAIYFIAADGKTYKGAAAAYHVLAGDSGGGCTGAFLCMPGSANGATTSWRGGGWRRPGSAVGCGAANVCRRHTFASPGCCCAGWD